MPWAHEGFDCRSGWFPEFGTRKIVVGSLDLGWNLLPFVGMPRRVRTSRRDRSRAAGRCLELGVACGFLPVECWSGSSS